jgi:hypothetical protein
LSKRHNNFSTPDSPTQVVGQEFGNNGFAAAIVPQRTFTAEVKPWRYYKLSPIPATATIAQPVTTLNSSRMNDGSEFADDCAERMSNDELLQLLKKRNSPAHVIDAGLSECSCEAMPNDPQRAEMENCVIAELTQ